MAITLESRIELHEIVARLDHAVDAQDWDRYLAFFDEGAVMDPGFAPPVHGREAIRGFLVASEGNTRGKRHVASNVFVDGDEREAVVRSYLCVIEREEIPKIVATALIVDTFARRAEGWRVVRHQVTVDPGMFKSFGG